MFFSHSRREPNLSIMHETKGRQRVKKFTFSTKKKIRREGFKKKKKAGDENSFMARLYKKLHRASENSKTADVNDGLLFYLLVLIYVKTDKVTERPKSCFHGWTNSPRLWAVKIGRGRIFPAMISTSHCEVIAFQREFIKS